MPRRHPFVLAGSVSRFCTPLRASGAEPLSFIYDGGRPPPPATHPPTSGEQPLTAVYTVLQPVRRTAGEHRCRRGGALPRLFTLTHCKQGVVFCYVSYNLTAIKFSLTVPALPGLSSSPARCSDKQPALPKYQKMKIPPLPAAFVLRLHTIFGSIIENIQLMDFQQ